MGTIKAIRPDGWNGRDKDYQPPAKRRYPPKKPRSFPEHPQIPGINVSVSMYRYQLEKHLDWIDPRAESIACSARQAILGAPSFYVGVTRYPRRSWLGGGHLTFEESHSSRWETMHVLSTHSHRVGDAEDALIKILTKEHGEQRCANIKGGGGGASPYKTNLLYVCVGPDRKRARPRLTLT